MLAPILRLISGRFAPTLILFAIAALWFSTGAALASTVILSGTHSESDILKSCVSAGGSFHSGPGGYGCGTDKGNVNCNKSGKCYGECETCGKPAITHKGGTVLGVLSGTTLKTGTAPTKPPVKPVHAKLPADSNPSAANSNEAHHDKKK